MPAIQSEINLRYVAEPTGEHPSKRLKSRPPTSIRTSTSLTNILWLTEYVDEVNSELSRLDFGESTIKSAVTDALASGGKRVRAVLALLWCETISGEYSSALPLAVAYELAHASALVQDDIIDDSDLRRGKSSIVRKYGLST